MACSAYSWSSEWNLSVPTAYDVSGNPISVYTYSTKASGNLYSTIEDIATFVSAGMIDSNSGNSVLKKDSIRKMYKPAVEKISGLYGLVFDSYGFGHYIEWFANGEKSISHGGQGTGWMSHYQSVPETGDGIVIITNSQRAWPVFAYLLSDWTAWSGFSAAGMEIIITGQKIVWFLIALLLFISVWQSWGIIDGLVHQRRKFSLTASGFRVMRLLKLNISITLIAGVCYAVNLEYQPLYSIFPIASHWFFYVLFFTGLATLFSVILPYKTRKV